MTIPETTTAEPTIHIDCPVCGATSVPSEWTENVEVVKILYLIPLYTHRTTFVRCSACEKQLIAQIAIADTANMSAEDLSHYLAARESFIGKFLALASVALCWAPIVGPVVGIMGLLVNRRSAPWTRTLSWIGTVLSVTVTIAFLVILALE